MLPGQARRQLALSTFSFACCFAAWGLISAFAPHPAAARLWEEFLYSTDGQNGFLSGYARPILMDSMKSAGTLDSSLAAKLPPVTGSAPVPSQDQITKAKAVVASNWSKAIAG